MPIEHQPHLSEYNPYEPSGGEFTYLDLLRNKLSAASFVTTTPDKDGMITLIDDMGYEFDISVHGGTIVGIVNSLGVESDS